MSLAGWLKHIVELFYASIREWISAENQPVALPFDVPGDLHRFSDQVQHLLVHGLALGGNQKEIECCAVLLAHQQNGRHATTNATDRTGPMRYEH